MVHAPQIMVMDDGVLARQCRRAARQPQHPFRLGRRGLARREGPLGQPPQQADANQEADEAVKQEHPLEADQAAEAVHELEAGGHETHDGGGDLGRREVPADALTRAGRGVEEGQVVRHAGPHAGDDDAEEEPEEATGGRERGRQGQ